MKLYPAIVELYEELYKQACLRRNFTYVPSKNERKTICKFIGWLYKAYKRHQLTEELLIQYFEFQFARYVGIRTPKGRNSIMVNWLVGPKAIKAWEQRDIKKRYYVKWKCNKDFKLKLREHFGARVKVSLVAFVNQLNRAEEQAKARFHNRPEGYVYCGDMTTLYNGESEICKECDFKEACIERLECTYPKLFEKRLKHGYTTENTI